MKYKKYCGLFAFILLFSFTATAFADTLEGRVAKASSSALDMTVYDAQGRPYPNTLHLKVDKSTRLTGFSSATALKKQDMVRVDVSQEKTGAWRANSISKLYASTAVKTAPAQPSPSLMDALRSPTGQKVIRNGVTGAVTGAVASGATGGKAGKGALIGAGVGIAGGILADILGGGGQPRQQNNSATVNTQDDRYNG